MTESMPIVEVISTVAPRWVSDFNALSSELANRGCKVSIHCPRPMKGLVNGWRGIGTIEQLRKQLHPEIDYRQLPYSGYNLGLIGLARSVLLGFRLAINKNQLTILWTILPILLFGPPLRLFNRRVIYQITGLGSVFAEPAAESRRRRITERVYAFLFTGTNYRIIVHNREDKKFLCERFSISSHKVHVTGGCGVDPAKFPFHFDYAGNTVPVIYAPIRLSVEKGVYDLCQASRLLELRGIQHELWFTSGIDPYQSTSLTQNDVDDIRQNFSSVQFLDFQPSNVETLRKADFVCVPTWYREGLPTAILEAASSGRALVTTNNVGGRDFVRDGLDGRLVDIKSPEALADAIAYMIDNPAKVEAMRQSAYKRFLSGYTKQHMVDISLRACAEIWPSLPEPIGMDTEHGDVNSKRREE